MVWSTCDECGLFLTEGSITCTCDYCRVNGERQPRNVGNAINKR